MDLRMVAMAIAASVITVALQSEAEEACSLTVRGQIGGAIGRIGPDGRIRDSAGSIIGRIDRGTVRNASGAAVGRIDADGKMRSASGAAIGRVDPDGRLRDRSGAAIGRIDPNGTVRNRSGAARGRFDGYLPACRRTAAAYLFFFEPLHGG